MASMETRTVQRQAQGLSPRLQQAVRLLQMSSLDFAAMVRASLNTNPFLEPDEAEDGVAAEADEDIVVAAVALPAATLEGDGDARADAAVDDVGDGMGEATGDDRDLWLDDVGRPARQGDEGENSALQMMATETTLAEHLHGQLHVLELPPRDLVLAHALVESLDEDGYLRSPLDELVDIVELDPPAEPDELLIALRRVQALDPAGVAARSVGECLRLQLPAIACGDLRALAQRIVDGHLDALAANNCVRLAQALGEPAARIEAACAAIRRLDPRPGWRFGSSRIAYVVPDVIVSRQHGEWTVRLNPAVVPRVKLNHFYAALFKRHRTTQDGALADHLQEARWTLHNVEQRFSTILDVAQAIVRRQHPFFDFGAMALKPLCLREIADEIGAHESTVSRVTNNKYMATPIGVFELKYFFSRAMVTASGKQCSGKAIRGLIEEMIREERPDAPLSDAEITRQLAQQGLVVARRTVTKYRQTLRIAAVDRRRRLVA
jgi:RNA polymerase sigma-54 factor